jgi:hypothetical protein
MPFEPSFPPPKEWAPPGAGLTFPQLSAIGAVVTTWAVIETVVQQLLFVLVQSPDKLGQALTEDLGPDHRLKALRRLCRDWEGFLEWRHSELTEMISCVREVRTYAAWIEKNKNRRNQIAHWQWMRMSDARMMAFKYTLKPPPENPKDGDSHISVSPEELMAFAEEISEKASAMILALRRLSRELPAWPRRPA